MPLNLFSRVSIPSKLPPDMKQIANQLKQSSSQQHCLQQAYQILTAKYHGDRLQTFTKLPQVFESNLSVLWAKNGFLHCVNLNYLLTILLVHSGFFNQNDIRFKWTLVWYLYPHQYLQVKVGNRWLNVDVWAHVYGLGLGDYAHGFHSSV